MNTLRPARTRSGLVRTGRIALAVLLFGLGFAPAASAAISQFQILLNLDNQINTGCDVPTLAGTFEGAEQILITTVTTSASSAQVTALQVQICTNPATNTFGPPSAVTAPPGRPLPWTVGVSNGTGGTSVIETYYPLSLSTVSQPPVIRLGVLAFDGSGVLRDELLRAQPTPGPNGPPILLNARGESITEIPTLSEWGLILLCLLLAAAAVALLRRRTATAFLLALLLLGGAGIAWALVTDLNGTTLGEWVGGTLLATEPASDAPAGTDIRAFYGFRDTAPDALSFRIDAALLFEPANVPPTALNDSAMVNEDSGANVIDVLANDTDPDGGQKLITAVQSPSGQGGTVLITNGGADLTYQPAANYCNNPPGTTLDTFTYTVNGGSTATVTVTVTCVDDPPVAFNDAVTVGEDSGANTINVLANDTDSDGGPKLVTAVQSPSGNGGTVLITNGGADLTYQPAADYCNNPPGTTLDTFTYTITGGATATVTVTVNCAGDAPALDLDANDDKGTGGANFAVTFTEGDPATLLQDPADATVTDTDSPNLASLTVTITNLLDPGFETLAANTAGTSISANYTLATGVLALTGSDTLANYQQVLRTVTYQNTDEDPDATARAITFVANDGASNSNTATSTVTVVPVNDNPTAVADAATVAEDSSANTINVLANDTDPDGGTKLITAVQNPSGNGGTVLITNGGADLTYTPAANYCNNPPGTTLDTFTYTITGGSVATVTVTVNCDDDVPTAVNDVAVVNEDSGANTINVLANDTDFDGGTNTVSAVQNPSAFGGTVLITNGGLDVSYTPAANYCNTPPGTTLDTFTYALSPGGSTATVTVTVNCLDDPPALDLDADDDKGTGGSDFAVTFTEGDAARLLEDPSDATLTDVDSANLTSLTVTLTNLLDTGFETLAADTTGTSITAAYTPGTGVLALTGSDTVANYQTVLRTITYLNTDDSPDPTPRVITFVANDGTSNSNTATSTVTIVPSNDNPTAVNDTATVAEDSSANTIDVLANDTDPDGGTNTITAVQNPSTQGGTVVITNGGADLTYTPAANYCNTPPGTTLDTFTYTLSPGGSIATVTVTVNCSDDAPTAVNDAATVNEDSGANTINVQANDTDVDGGTNTITAVQSPSTFGGTVVITNGGADLTYTPAANYCNTPPGTTLDTFTYTLSPGGSVATVTVTVTCLDDNPVAVNDAATVGEDSGANTINVLVNDTDVDGGTKTITAVQTPSTFGGTVAITNGGADLTYTPAANYCNTPPGTTLDTFTYTLSPGGSIATVTVSVTCVDDNPVGVNDAATVLEDSVANTINVLANDTDVDGGTKTITAVQTPSTFGGTVQITNAGADLTYTPAANYCNAPPGTTLDTFTYTISPGGSIATVTVTVTCVDDPPTAVADSATVDEDSGANAINVLANDTDIDAGPKFVNSVQNPSAFGGSVLITGGGTGVSYQPGPNYCNTPPGTTLDTFTYTLNGGSSTTVTVAVNCINDPPVPDPDFFDFIGNTELRVDLAASATPHTLEDTGGAPFGVVEGDSDPVEGDTILVSAITVGACTDMSAPFDCSDPAVGRVQMQADGRFSFEPAPGDTGAAVGPECPAGAVDKETFTYTLTDDGDPAPASAIGTVTLCRFGRVWFVDPNAGGGGDGTSDAPLNTLDALDGAGGAGDSDSPTDHIFVHDGTLALSGALPLEANQHLIGQGHVEVTTPANFALSIPVSLNGNGSPTNLVASGTHPQLTNATGDAVTVTTAVPVEIVGLSLASTTGNAIDLTSAAALTGSGTLRVENNEFRAAGAEGIDVNLNVGTTGALTLNVTDNSWDTGGTHTGNAVDINRAAGTLRLDFSNNANLVSANAAGAAVNINGGAAASTTIIGFSGNSVHQNTAGSGIFVSNATFDATPGGALDQVSAGTTSIGILGNGAGGAGLVMSAVTGDLQFGSFSIYADGGAGLSVAGTGSFTGAAGTRIGLTGLGDVEATGGPAASLSNLTAALTFNTLESTNSASTGVSLTGVAGTFTAPSSSSITNAGTTDFVIDSTSAAVTYNGTITDDVGQLVSVSNSGGSLKSFTGAITDGDDGDGGGISLTGNSSTLRFSGGVVLSTGGNAAFTATGGGTVEVCDENPCNPGATGLSVNRITTTTGTALNVANTNIGANNLEFQRISAGTAASGPANGIVINNTGSSGGLKIKGTGIAASGGTIQRGGTGISLTSTRNVSLSSMQLNDFSDYAIRGSSVVNFTMDATTISGVNGDNDATDDDSVRFTELTGSASVTNSSISGGWENNFTVVNTTGTLNRITFDNVTIGANSSGFGSDGILVEGQGTAVVNVTATNSDFTSSRGDHFQLNLLGTASTDVIFTGNTITNAHPAVVSGGGGIRLTGGAAGSNTTATYNISNNTLRDSNGTAIGVTKGAGAGTFTGTIDNNQIGVAGVANSGSSGGSGISVILAETGSQTVSVTNNQIRQYNNFGIIVQAGGTGVVGSGTLRATVTGNTISNPGTAIFAKNGFQLNSGTLPGETYQVCLTFGGAGALRNSLVGTGTDGGTDFRLRQRQSTTVRLPGYGGANNDDAAVTAFAQGNNNIGGTPTGSATNTVPTGGGWIGGACP